MAIDNLSELIKRTMIQTMRQLRVSMPCEVVRYNSKRQMVDVRIVQPEIDLAGNNIPMPVITNIPVSFVRCGNSHITHPINKGDTGFIVFADRDISSWVETNNTSVVDSARTHSMQDSYFVPGIVGGGNNANPNDVEIKYNNTTIHLRKNGDVDINTPSKVNVNASNVIINSETTNNGNVQINGNLTVSQMLTTGGFTSLGTSGGGTAQFTGSINVTDDVIASNVSLNSHLHSGVQSGTSNTGQPI
jgi:hypothetical protein